MFFVTLFLICGSAFATDLTRVQEFDARWKNGIDTLFSTGVTNEDLHRAYNDVGFRHLFTNDYLEKVDPQLICSACTILVDAVIDELRSGTSEHTLIGYLKDACKNLDLFSSYICDRVLDLNIGAVYVANKPGIDTVYACALVFQNYKCKSPVRANWTVEIHDGESVEKPKGSGKALQVLHLTDFHYDPIYKPGSNSHCRDPLCCQQDTGAPSDPQYAAGYWGEYGGCDLPMHTIEDGFKHISKEHPNIDYIYYTGDIVSHRVWATSEANNTQAMVDVLGAIENNFKNVPVFPLLGNHETHPVNVWISDPNVPTSAQWLFEEISELWMRWLPEYTKETILKGGYYTVLVSPGFRIIALNSNVAYTFNWWLLYDEVDPYGQLKWLEGVLYEAEKNNEIVHILSHVPSEEGYVHWFTLYNKIVQRYTNTIAAIFNGHTHNDELILYHDTNDNPINIAWNGGSFTPFSYNNPNYRIMHVDDTSFDVLDYDVWILNISEANSNLEKPTNWFKLYSFKEAYGVEGLTPNDIADLALRMAKEDKKDLLDKYFRYRSREGPGTQKGCDEKCKQALLCKMVTSVHDQNDHCKRLIDQWNWEK